MSQYRNSSAKYFVYKHTAPNGKVYIGITCKVDPQKRWNNGAGYCQQKHFFNAILKYGWDNFKHEILFSSLDKIAACQKEVELIAEYKSMDPKYGYNTKSGGDIGFCSNAVSKKEEGERVKAWWNSLSPEKRQYMETHLRNIAVSQWIGASQEEKNARTAACRKARKAAWDAMTPDERKAVAIKGNAKRRANREARTPEQIAEQSRNYSNAQTKKWAKIKSSVSKMSPEEQAAWHKKKADIVRKAWIARKAKLETTRINQQAT